MNSVGLRRNTELPGKNGGGRHCLTGSDIILISSGNGYLPDAKSPDDQIVRHFPKESDIISNLSGKNMVYSFPVII